MAQHSLSRLVLLCIVALATLFACSFLFNELPKKSADSAVSELRDPIFDIQAANEVRGVEIRGDYTPPLSWTTNDIGSTEEVALGVISGAQGPFAPVISEEAINSNSGLSLESNEGIVIDEEKLRENVVKEDPTWVSWQKMNQVRYLSLLTGASIASSVICHPLHVIMMRQQVGAMATKGGMLGVYYSVQEAIETLGMRGLFRGWVPLMLEAPSHALYFSVTESSREYLQTFFRKTFQFFGYKFTISTFFVDILQSLISALLANGISLIPWVPAEILSAKLAIQDRKGAIGMNEMISQIYRKEGIFGFFKGFFSSLTVHVTYSFLWWVSYSTTRRQVEIFFPTLQRDNLILYDAITGILAGLASGFFNHPLDTIKLRIQTEIDDEDKDKDRERDRENQSYAPYKENQISYSFTTDSDDCKYEKENDFKYTRIKRKKISHNLISMGLLIIEKDGFQALFSGICASMYSTIFSSAFFCIIYEMIKRQSTIA